MHNLENPDEVPIPMTPFLQYYFEGSRIKPGSDERPEDLIKKDGYTSIIYPEFWSSRATIEGKKITSIYIGRDYRHFITLNPEEWDRIIDLIGAQNYTGLMVENEIKNLSDAHGYEEPELEIEHYVNLVKGVKKRRILKTTVLESRYQAWEGYGYP